MEQTKKTPRVNIITLVLILGLVAFVAYFVFFVNPAQVIDILSKTNLAIYAGAFVAYALYSLFSGLVWQRLLNSLSVKVSTRKAVLFTWVGLFFDATVPQLGWSGEVSKTYLLSKDANIDAAKIGASVVGQKIFNMTLTIAALSSGLALVLFNYSLPIEVALLFIVVLVLSIVALSLVCYVSIKPSATKTLLQWAIKVAKFFRKSWNPQNFTAKADEMLGRFHSGIAELKANPKALIEPIMYAVLSFACEVSVMALSFIALGQPVPLDKVLIVFTLTGTLQSVGVTFFLPDLIMIGALGALSISPSLAFSVTLLTRVVNLWFRLVVSYGALQWAGIKILKNGAPALN